jgi:hypothetical protein
LRSAGGQPQRRLRMSMAKPVSVTPVGTVTPELGQGFWPSTQEPKASSSALQAPCNVHWRVAVERQATREFHNDSQGGTESACESSQLATHSSTSPVDSFSEQVEADISLHRSLHPVGSPDPASPNSADAAASPGAAVATLLHPASASAPTEIERNPRVRNVAGTKEPRFIVVTASRVVPTRA